MNTKLTGIFNEGDTERIREWVKKETGSIYNSKDELAEIRTEIKSLRKAVESMDKKIERIEKFLEKFSD
jgi:phage-related tail protein